MARTNVDIVARALAILGTKTAYSQSSSRPTYSNGSWAIACNQLVNMCVEGWSGYTEVSPGVSGASAAWIDNTNVISGQSKFHYPPIGDVERNIKKYDLSIITDNTYKRYAPQEPNKYQYQYDNIYPDDNGYTEEKLIAMLDRPRAPSYSVDSTNMLWYFYRNQFNNIHASGCQNMTKELADFQVFTSTADFDSMKPGELIFHCGFSGDSATVGGHEIDHVGIYLGKIGDYYAIAESTIRWYNGVNLSFIDPNNNTNSTDSSNRAYITNLEAKGNRLRAFALFKDSLVYKADTAPNSIHTFIQEEENWQNTAQYNTIDKTASL